MVRLVIHSNPSLANQIETSGWLRAGFAAHGIDAEVTADKDKPADVHVIQGPWYAYREWLGKPNVLYLDRGFWGSYRYDVSVGWLRPDGSRNFCNADKTVANGPLPILKPLKERRRAAVVFADYGQDCTKTVRDARLRYDAVYFRPHPSAQNQSTPAMTLSCDLDAVWALADVAIGHSSTVLVKAHIEGLHPESSDPLHVVHYEGDRAAWLTRLSWANWNYADICSGAMWENLKNDYTA